MREDLCQFGIGKLQQNPGFFTYSARQRERAFAIKIHGQWIGLGSTEKGYDIEVHIGECLAISRAGFLINGAPYA